MNTFLAPNRKVLIISVFLFMFSATAFSQMRNIYLDADSTNSIKKISFYSPSQGYIATKKWVGYSADSGRTFTKNYITLGNVNFNGYSVNLTFGFSINGVKAFNKDTVITYGDYGLVPAILYSTDGCSTFKLVYHSQYNSLTLKTGIKDIIFPQNNAIGFAVDADRILKTTNKGLTWVTSSILISAYYDYLEAVDNNNVIAFSTQYNNTSFKKTSNGGTIWLNVAMPSLTTPTICYANFYSSSKGWLNIKDANNLQYMYYTSNGGLSWRLMNKPSITPFIASKMQFINDSTGYAISDLYKTYITTDTGKLWQQIPKNNAYAYYYATHNHLQIYNNSQLWSGGEHGFLEINTNIKAAPIPKAYFQIDTTGIYTSNIVKLDNYSKQGYQYAWYKNDTLISNNYNTTYTHISNRVIDTIKLIVTNSMGADTAIKYAYFNPPVIVSSFAPTSGETNTKIIITGSNFLNATDVLFGGVSANSYTVNSNTKITAYVDVGATGSVTVITPKSSGSLAGFTYLQPPTINIPFTVSKNVLCKSESTSIIIPNSQLNVRYRLVDSLNNLYASSIGNGNSITINTSKISVTGTYRLVVNNVGSNNNYWFTNTIFLTVEHTKSLFIASKVNVELSEPFNVVQQSTDAQSFNWNFGTNANIVNSILPDPQNISYSQTGLKAIQLISTSANGCRDTLLGDAVYVYSKPNPNDVCYTQNIDDSDFSYVPYSPPTFAKISAANNNGYFVSGYGNKPILKSRYGIAKKINDEGTAYFAHYNTDGILRWYMNIKELSNNSHFTNTLYGFSSSNFYGSTQDSLGNIYIIGSCRVYNYLFLPNGDSIAISRPTTGTPQSRVNGFVLKVDSVGKYLWHTVLDDSTREYGGYTVEGGIPNSIKLANNNLYITGSFLHTLNYNRNSANINMAAIPYGFGYGEQNNFVLKIDTSGAYQWSTYFQNDATNHERKIADIGVDANDNVYVLGGYEGKVILRDVLDSTVTLTRYNFYQYNTYLLKFNSAGKKMWLLHYPDSEPNELVCDAAGNTYITGIGYVFGRSFLVTNSDNSVNTINLSGFHLFKIGNNGVLKWTVGSKVGGSGYSVYLDKNNLYTLGKFSSSGLVADTSILTSTNNIGFNKIINTNHFLVINYDTAGILKNVFQSGYNTNTSLTPNKIIKDKNQQFLISGKTDAFNPNTSYTLFGSSFLSNGQDAFWGKFNVDFCSTITPLTLLSFKAALKQENIHLDWITTNQINTSHFNIQRSTNSVNFETIGVVNSRGNGSYVYIDKDLPSSNTVFYRLEIIDQDGTIQYSSIQTINLTQQASNILLYPNPSKDNFTIKFPATTKGINIIKVLDMYGKTVIEKKTVIGSQQINISQTLTKGIYTVQITNSITNKTNQQKLIIQ